MIGISPPGEWHLGRSWLGTGPNWEVADSPTINVFWADPHERDNLHLILRHM